MKFRAGDELLAMDVVRPGAQLFVVTEGGFAKRTDIDEYRVQGRGGLGIKVANLVEARGDLVGALITDEDDEVLVIMERGKIVRSAVAEVNVTGRNTQGVTFAKPDRNDRIIAVARNIERQEEEAASVDGGLHAEPAGETLGDDVPQVGTDDDTVVDETVPDDQPDETTVVSEDDA
jgi:DNA gyrase subunit A